MKQLKSLLILCAFTLITTTISANNGGGDDEAKTTKEINNSLVEELGTLLKDPDLFENEVGHCSAVIQFVINSAHEIKLIDVFADNKYIDKFIEERLQDKVIKTKGVLIKKTYTMPVNFELP